MNNEKADVRLEDVEGTKAELDKKAQKMLEDKDADSRMRIYDGPLGKAIVVLLCVWTAFQLYFTTIGAISPCLRSARPAPPDRRRRPGVRPA